MRIGLMTIFQVPNFGSVLQAYATQKILENLGHECKVINYKFPNEWHYQKGAYVRPNPIKKKLRSLGLRATHRKERNLKAFCKAMYNFTDRYSDYAALQAADWNDIDAFVSGSDQVWNPRYLKGDPAFLLSFVPDDKPKYSIASSFALKELPSDYVESYKSALSGFRKLSVREQNGVEIINSHLGIDKDVLVCLDPTLLLDSEDWLRTVPRSGFKKKRSYILFYMWTYAFEPRPYIFEVLKYFQNKIGICDVIAIEGYTPTKEAMGVKMKEACDSTIPEFIDLFANADLVITSSFHGTAFAVNFGRPLISIVPDNLEDDRQTTLLTNLGISNCIIKLNSNINDINPNYNAEQLQNRLSVLQYNNIEWIKKSIK